MESTNCVDSSGFEVLVVLMSGCFFCFERCHFFVASRVVSVAVSAAGNEHTVQRSSPGYDQVKLVPVVRSWIFP